MLHWMLIFFEYSWSFHNFYKNHGQQHPFSSNFNGIPFFCWQFWDLNLFSCHTFNDALITSYYGTILLQHKNEHANWTRHDRETFKTPFNEHQEIQSQSSNFQLHPNDMCFLSNRAMCQLKLYEMQHSKISTDKTQNTIEATTGNNNNYYHNDNDNIK